MKGGGVKTWEWTVLSVEGVSGVERDDWPRQNTFQLHIWVYPRIWCNLVNIRHARNCTCFLNCTNKYESHFRGHQWTLIVSTLKWHIEYIDETSLITQCTFFAYPNFCISLCSQSLCPLCCNLIHWSKALYTKNLVNTASSPLGCSTIVKAIALSQAVYFHPYINDTKGLRKVSFDMNLRKYGKNRIKL